MHLPVRVRRALPQPRRRSVILTAMDKSVLRTQTRGLPLCSPASRRYCSRVCCARATSNHYCHPHSRQRSNTLSVCFHGTNDFREVAPGALRASFPLVNESIEGIERAKRPDSSEVGSRSLSAFFAHGGRPLSHVTHGQLGVRKVT